MTAQQIAVNAVAAARLAEIEPRGYIMARMYETLANIDTEGEAPERHFGNLTATAEALPIVWDVDADEPDEDEIAVAAAEAITDVGLEEVDHTALPEQNAEEVWHLQTVSGGQHVSELREWISETPLQKAQRILFGKMGAK